MRNLIFLYELGFTVKDLVVNIVTVTLLSLVMMAILSAIVYIIYKLIKGED